MTAPASPIPVTLPTGFLGSGKTTLPSNLIRDAGMGRVSATIIDKPGGALWPRFCALRCWSIGWALRPLCAKTRQDRAFGGTCTRASTGCLGQHGLDPL